MPTSSPSTVHPLYENMNKQQPPLPQPSLSESAIRVSANQKYATQTISRPSRFVKPTSSSSTLLNNNQSFTLDMKNYVQLVESYSQKIYMEGYLMQNKKKYYAELGGSTFTLWDTTKQGATVTPEFIPIVLDINVYASSSSSNNHRQQFILELPHKNKTMKLNTLDPVALKKWIAAFRLACFERQLVHQFYTFHLFLQGNLNTNHTSSGYLQVLLPNSKNNNEWKKLWVNIIPSSSSSSLSNNNNNNNNNINNNTNTNNTNNNTSRKSKLLSSPTSIPQLVLLENKKSKQPLLTINCIHHAYALYPEMPSLIHQSTLIRLEGVQQNGDIMEILLMADSNQHMIQWLSTLYNAFSLYGLPHSLLQDANNPSSLNFGEIIPSSYSNENHNNEEEEEEENKNMALHKINPQWWLETDDIVQHMDILSSSTNKYDMYQLFVNALSHKQQTSLQAQYQQRAKSLPLITVESIDPSRQRAASDAGLLNESSMIRSQVADSSDESDDDFDEEEEEEEPDSDDEPIGKSKPLVNKKNGLLHQSKENNSSSSLLIPDFDFGNGFDTTDKCESSNSSLKNELTATTSSGSSSLHSTSRRKSSHHQQKRQYSSSSSIMSNNSNGSGSHGSGNNNDQPKKSNASSILFGDFSLTADFNKYLDPTFTSSSSKPSSRSPTPDRKYSLPLKSFSPATNASHGFDRRKSLWDADDQQHHGWDERSPRTRYIDEDLYQGDNEDDDDHPLHPHGYDQEGPLIPSLNDHFAPQNSLLDNALGEQLSAKEQIEFARATGQPLIQVPTKQGPPKGGLVGVISERERHRRQGQNARVAERVQQHHFDRLEREKERRILEQRQQQMMKHQMMMYAANGYVHPMMMHPYMNPPSPGNNMMPIPPLMSPGSPHTSTSSPITPTSPMPGSPLLYGRPYSPSNNNNNSNSPIYHPNGTITHPHPLNNNGIPMTPNSTQYSARRYSKPLLSEEEDDDDDEDEPLYNTSLAYQQYPRTASPTIFHRKMNPMPSTSTGSSGIRL
ncbi:unnamed protein product [Cunninghamella blakesleeana]